MIRLEHGLTSDRDDDFGSFVFEPVISQICNVILISNLFIEFFLLLL